MERFSKVMPIRPLLFDWFYKIVFLLLILLFRISADIGKIVRFYIRPPPRIICCLNFTRFFQRVRLRDVLFSVAIHLYFQHKIIEN
jgi:hypothetical protein